MAKNQNDQTAVESAETAIVVPAKSKRQSRKVKAQTAAAANMQKLRDGFKSLSDAELAALYTAGFKDYKPSSILLGASNGKVPTSRQAKYAIVGNVVSGGKVWGRDSLGFPALATGKQVGSFVSITLCSIAYVFTGRHNIGTSGRWALAKRVFYVSANMDFSSVRFFRKVKGNFEESNQAELDVWNSYQVGNPAELIYLWLSNPDSSDLEETYQGIATAYGLYVKQQEAAKK